MGLPGLRGSVWGKGRSLTRLQDVVLQRSQVRSGDEGRDTLLLQPLPHSRAQSGGPFLPSGHSLHVVSSVAKLGGG